MLNRENRLLKQPFSIFLESNAIQTPLFVLKVAKNNGNGKRFGFIVSKRVDKKAVVRNRVKRVFRASSKELIDRISQDQDFLFIVKKKAVLETQSKILEEIENTLKKKKILK